LGGGKGSLTVMRQSSTEEKKAQGNDKIMFKGFGAKEGYGVLVYQERKSNGMSNAL